MIRSFKYKNMWIIKLINQEQAKVYSFNKKKNHHMKKYKKLMIKKMIRKVMIKLKVKHKTSNFQILS